MKERKQRKSELHTHIDESRYRMWWPSSALHTASAKGTAGWLCHVCITRHWFFCRGLALQPFILCFAVGPNGFEKFCYSPVTPEAKVRIDFTCTGLHHLSRAWAVRAKAKWNAIHTQALRQALRSARRAAVRFQQRLLRAAWSHTSPCSLGMKGDPTPPKMATEWKVPLGWWHGYIRKVFFFFDKNKSAATLAQTYSISSDLSSEARSGLRRT